MKKGLLTALIITAFIFAGLGITISFINVDRFGVRINNAEFVSAIFNLSGIILFFTALMYQIKEYKLLDNFNNSLFATD